MSNLTFAMQLGIMAPTQYGNYNFNSMCNFRGKAFGAHEDGGIHLLDNRDETADEGSVEIDALLELAQTDFGVPNVKTILKVVVGYEASGELEISVISDEYEAVSGTLPESAGNFQQHGDWTGVVSLGRYALLRIQNVEGCDFSLDSIDVYMIVSPIRRLVRE